MSATDSVLQVAWGRGPEAGRGPDPPGMPGAGGGEACKNVPFLGSSPWKDAVTAQVGDVHFVSSSAAVLPPMRPALTPTSHCPEPEQNRRYL